MKSSHLTVWLLRITFGIAFTITLWAISPLSAIADRSQGFGFFADSVLPPLGPSADPSGISPEVLSFISGTYLAHTEEFPDPKETVPVLEAYLKGNQFLADGKIAPAIALFEKTIARYPDARHAHTGLARAQLYNFRRTKDIAHLSESVQEFSRAAEIGLKFGKVRYTEILAKEWAALGDASAMDLFFERALTIGDRPSTVHLDYARGLRFLGDNRAEQHLKSAVELSPEGNANAIVSYAEFLLDNQREDEAIALIGPNPRPKYLRFLRGVGLERLGKGNEALSEYKEYHDMSQDFPAPLRFRIANSLLQQQIAFALYEETNVAMTALLDDDTNLPDDPNVPDRKVRRRLSWLLTCEAHDESLGGMRAVAWTVRTRVFRGNAGPLDCRIAIDNNGASVPDKYWSVMNQSDQFTLDCDKSRTSQTNETAYDVYFGYVPDTVTGYCGCGGQRVGGTLCSDTAACDFFDTSCINGAPLHGPILFWSNSCPTTKPYSCATQAGFTCANGGNENCFFKRP